MLLHSHFAQLSKHESGKKKETHEEKGKKILTVKYFSGCPCEN